MIVTKPPVKKNNTGDCWGCLGGGVPEGIRNVSKGTDYPLTSPPKSVETVQAMTYMATFYTIYLTARSNFNLKE
jgi:hypothetical protein